MKPAKEQKLWATATLCGVLLLTGCTDGTPVATPTQAEPTSVPTEDSSPTPAQTVSGSRGDAPKGVIDGFAHGQRYYGVYVFVGEFDDAGYDATIKRLRRMGLKRGVNFSDGELRCDEGAAEALELSDEEAGRAIAVAVYFKRQPDAQAFAMSLDPPPIGVARVRTLCAD